MGQILHGNHARIGEPLGSLVVAKGTFIPRHRFTELCVKGFGIYLDKEIPRLHPGIILHRHGLHDSGDLGRDIMNVPGDIGIVGRFIQETNDPILDCKKQADAAGNDQSPVPVVRFDF